MIKITIKDKQTGLKKELQIARSLSGDYMLREHPELDFVVMPQKNKIVAFPKDEYSDHVYSIQNDFFKYLADKGVIDAETIAGGNVYGTLQASYTAQPPGGENPLQVAVYNVASFIEDQRPIFVYEKEFEDTMEKELLHPDISDSTELGEVPQEKFKGSIPKYGFPTRGIYRYNY